MKKYGFVYIWFDRKHNRFYIGCRWGHEDDGYICSSPWMKQGYNHRPQDFKREVLSRVYSDKKALLEEEYRWLSKIKSEELGKRYYNLHNHHFGHWSSDENLRMTVGQKISAAPDRKRKIGIANKGKKPARHTIEATIAVRLGKTYEELYGFERANKIREKKRLQMKGRVLSEETKIKMSSAAKLRKSIKPNEETRKKMSESQKKRHNNMKVKNEKHL